MWKWHQSNKLIDVGITPYTSFRSTQSQCQPPGCPDSSCFLSPSDKIPKIGHTVEGGIKVWLCLPIGDSVPVITGCEVLQRIELCTTTVII